MTAHRQTLKIALGLALAAGAIAPAAASARFDQNPVYFPGPTSTPHHARLDSIRIDDQIRLVKARMVPEADLGPNALKIYRAGGVSTAEPDAQAVKEAASGSLLTGRTG